MAGRRSDESFHLGDEEWIGANQEPTRPLLEQGCKSSMFGARSEGDEALSAVAW